MIPVYFGIKFYPDNSNRSTIEAFEACLAKQGMCSYCVARDMERWGALHFPPEQLMAETFRKIDEADKVIIEMSEKGVGLGIEAGYAKALGKELIIVHQAGTELSTTIKGIASTIITYDAIEDIVF